MENEKRCMSEPINLSQDDIESPDINIITNVLPTNGAAKASGEGTLEELSRVSYESDLQHIDNLLKKYQMFDDPINEEFVKDEKPMQETYVTEDEIEDEVQGKQCSSSDSEILDDAVTQDEQAELLEETNDEVRCSNQGNQGTDELNVISSDGHGEEQPERDILESQTIPEENSVKDDTWSTEYSKKEAYLEEKPDINANRTKATESVGVSFTSETYQKDCSQWQHDFNEDSATFQIFQVPNTVETAFSSEQLDEDSEEIPPLQKTDILPDSPPIPDDIKVNISKDCDSEIVNKSQVIEESIQNLQASKYRQSSIEQQVKLYTTWYQNTKDFFAPLSCSYSSYNVFSMAKKLAVLVLVLVALLYSMMVPSPDYEYEITKGLGPQALYYYKLVEGKKGYHQVNNLLFDTGQVYPPPRKAKPTMPPSKYRKRKKRRRKVPSHVKRVLPDVMKQRVNAIENNEPVQVPLQKLQFDETDKRFNKQRQNAFQNKENDKEFMYRNIDQYQRDTNNNARNLPRKAEIEDNERDRAQDQVNDRDATSGEFYKILPGVGELNIHLRKEECGEYCMYRIGFQKLPDGLTESRMVTWQQWKGQYRLTGLDKNSPYMVEICKYGNEGSTKKCDKIEVRTQ